MYLNDKKRTHIIIMKIEVLIVIIIIFNSIPGMGQSEGSTFWYLIQFLTAFTQFLENFPNLMIRES